MPEPITLDELFHYLERAVQENGWSFVYGAEERNRRFQSAQRDIAGTFSYGYDMSCEYNACKNDSSPCIIGKVLAYHGFDTEGLQGPIETPEWGEEEDPFDPATFMTKEALEVAKRVQRRQDNGYPWGLAVYETVSELGMYFRSMNRDS